MTFRERFEKEHPAGKGERQYLKFCPHDFGYEPDDYACDEMPNCEACWEREMPEGGNQ